ncbi:MAG: hypothetical protein U0Q12_21905 [Vicinamibacterales bacterium]
MGILQSEKGRRALRGLTTGAACAIGVWLSSAPARAQTPAAPQPSPSASGTASDEMLKGRYQVRVMEGVLESAVQHAAQMVNRRMQALAPDLVLLTGTARVRGFRLDGYGVFFDVDVPALRQSMSWTFRTLSQNNLRAEEALRSIRRLIETQRDKVARAELEQALKLLELRGGPLPHRDGDAVRPVAVGATASGDPPTLAASTTTAPPPADAPPPLDPGLLVDDPGLLYTSEVKQALIEAILDHSSPMNVAPGEWITIGARDNGDLGMPTDASDTVTMVIRLKGEDLVAFRADRLSRDEVRRRVEVRTF